jgi:hypothetical protein
MARKLSCDPLRVRTALLNMQVVVLALAAEFDFELLVNDKIRRSGAYACIKKRCPVCADPIRERAGMRRHG